MTDRISFKYPKIVLGEHEIEWKKSIKYSAHAQHWLPQGSQEKAGGERGKAGCFNAYLKRFKKRGDESCRYRGSLVENAEHTLFVCARWSAEREAVGQVVGAQLTPVTMVSHALV